LSQGGKEPVPKDGRTKKKRKKKKKSGGKNVGSKQRKAGAKFLFKSAKKNPSRKTIRRQEDGKKGSATLGNRGGSKKQTPRKRKHPTKETRVMKNWFGLVGKLGPNKRGTGGVLAK